MAPRANTEADFWSHTREMPNGCLEWTGTIISNGYGTFSFQGKTYLAHRLAYTFRHGVAPGKCVRHRCDNPCCVNPDHLLIGTQADNIKDRDERGRTATGDRNGARVHPERLSRGADRWNAKLDETKVEEIRSRIARGEVSRIELAREYGVSASTINGIVRGEKWTHV